jgi:hypothetical protein
MTNDHHATPYQRYLKAQHIRRVAKLRPNRANHDGICEHCGRDASVGNHEPILPQYGEPDYNEHVCQFDDNDIPF